MSREFPLSRVRNIGIMAHIDAGKTTCSERILYYAGTTHKLGETHDGAATMDFMAQEKERGITIQSAATTFHWKEHLVTLLDTPGHVDFTVEVERSLRVLDGAVALFCAVGGVEPQSEKVWVQSEKYEVPKIAFINKMDRIGADFYGVLGEIQRVLKCNATPLVLPIGAEDQFAGIVDLLRMKAVRYDAADGARFHEAEIPEAMRGVAEEWHGRLVEKCAELDDGLMELYLAGQEPTREELLRVLRRATIARKIVPVLCGSAFKNKGIQHLLDAVVHLLPAPDEIPPVMSEIEEGAEGAGEIREPRDDAPFAALAFKIVADRHAGKLTYIRVYSGTLTAGQDVFNSTLEKTQRVGRILRMHVNHTKQLKEARTGDIVAIVGLAHTRTGDTICGEGHPIRLSSIEFPPPVVSVSATAESSMDNDRLGEALHQLADEDPTFTVNFDRETGETVISGMGELHLEIIVDRLRREYGIPTRAGRPEVAYRESGTHPVEGVYRHIKQTGGRGQYAHVVMAVEPVPAGSGFEFVNEVVGGRIPSNYIPAIEKGVVAAMRAGPYAGYPVVDVRVRLLDGSYHEVDSSDFAFQEAGRAGFKELFLKTSPILLEPVMNVEVTCPEEYMGAVSGSICQRRGRIEMMEEKHGRREVHGMVPLAEMFGYANAVRSLTQGRASFSMRFEHYEAVPFFLTEQIVKKRRAENKVR